MAEPHASTASAAGSAFGIGLVAGFVNPVLQHWALVAVGIGFGAFMAVSGANTGSVRTAAAVFLRAVAVAVPLTGLCAVFLAPKLGTTYDNLLMPVAFVLAWRHDKLGAAFDWVLSKLPKRGAS